MINYFCLSDGLRVTSQYRKCYVSSSYIDCINSHNGGAIYCSASFLYVLASSFIHCHSDSFGGSIYSGNTLVLSCDSFTNSFADKGLAFQSSSLISKQISCAYCTGNVSTFRILGHYAYIKQSNTSYTATDHQASCFSLSTTSFFSVMFMTCAHSSEVNSVSFALYRSQGLLTLLNAYNITTKISNNGFIVVGNGANVTITNSSFQHNGHTAIIDLYTPLGNETVIIQNCHFVSPIRTFIPCVETISLSFEEQFSFIPYKIGGKCEQPPYSLCGAANYKKRIVFLFIFFLHSLSN